MIRGLRAFDTQLEDGTLVKVVFRSHGFGIVQIEDVVNRGRRETMLAAVLPSELRTLHIEAEKELENLESANENRVYEEWKDAKE